VLDTVTIYLFYLISSDIVLSIYLRFHHLFHCSAHFILTGYEPTS
jgi:hypothetical protein